MLVKEIVEIIEGCLYSAEWEGEETDSYMKMLNELDDDNCMIISGYGIKLVMRMQDHPDLMKELNKLDVLDQYIEHRGIVTFKDS